jgi:hypothetical protein
MEAICPPRLVCEKGHHHGGDSGPEHGVGGSCSAVVDGNPKSGHYLVVVNGLPNEYILSLYKSRTGF